MRQLILAASLLLAGTASAAPPPAAAGRRAGGRRRAEEARQRRLPRLPRRRQHRPQGRRQALRRLGPRPELDLLHRLPRRLRRGTARRAEAEAHRRRAGRWWPGSAKASWGEGEHAVKVTAPAAYLACAELPRRGGRRLLRHVGPRQVAARGRQGARPDLRHLPRLAAHPGQEAGSPTPRPARARVAVPADRRAMQKACEACHGNEEFAKAAGLNAEVKHTYQDSIHGRMVRVGNAVAPTCVSCHAADKAGRRHARHRRQDRPGLAGRPRPTARTPARRCHEGATDNFARLIAHKPIQETGGHIVPHVTHVAFSYLTTLTLLFFAFHVLIDFIYELRQRLAAKGHGVTADDMQERDPVRHPPARPALVHALRRHPARPDRLAAARRRRLHRRAHHRRHGRLGLLARPS